MTVVVNPATEEAIAEVSEGTAEDADRAGRRGAAGVSGMARRGAGRPRTAVAT
jgi:acyl-CoA reductase-like NAD-dependent aldehyde dehydrogenase